MKPYQVSASIVVYNNDPADVTAAIRSVLSSAMRVRCTVVDNSPNSDLRQAVTESGAHYIHAGKNCGFGAGHNIVLKGDIDLAEYHLVLNPDVYFEPDILLSLYRLMSDNQDVGLVMPRILYPDGDEQRLCKQLPSPIDLLIRRFVGQIGRRLFATQLNRYELRYLDLKVPREIPNLSGCFMFVRSEILRQVGFFDERFFMYMEDVDLCRRIGRLSKTAFYPKVSITHGYAKGSYRNPKLLKYHLQSAFRYFCKWGWIFDRERNVLNKRTSPLVEETSFQCETTASSQFE